MTIVFCLMIVTALAVAQKNHHTSIANGIPEFKFNSNPNPTNVSDEEFTAHQNRTIAVRKLVEDLEDASDNR